MSDTDHAKEPPNVLAGYVEIDGARDVPHHYIPIYLYDKGDIFKLRKAEGMTIEETLQRIRTHDKA